MRHPSFLPALCFFPLSWVFCAFVLTQILFALGLNLAGGQWVWGAALVLTAVLVPRLFEGLGTKDVVAAGAIMATAWLVLCGVAAVVHDFSYDGQAYHQEAIIRLGEGWNPWTQSLTAEQTNQYKWLNGYPKITWQVGTLSYRIWNRIETAKVAMWLIGISAAGFAALWARRAAATSPAPRLVWVTYLLLMLNPIALCQWATFQLDGFVYWCLVGMLCALASVLYPRSSPLSQPVALVIFALFALSLATAKFTGIVFAVYATLVMGALLWHRRKTLPVPSRRGLILASVATVAVTSLCMVHPYLHNTLRHQHPLWPVLGPKTIDIIGYAEHSDFVRRDRVTKFLWSNNARARNLAGFTGEADDNRYGRPRWKVPFSLYRSEIRPYVAPDVHIGGFGPWFGGGLLVGTILLVICAARNTPGARPGVVAWALVWGGVLINPEAWWVRYSPHGWWLVLIPIAVAVGGAERPLRVSGYVLAGLMLLNAAFVGVVNTGGQYVCERSFAKQYGLLRAAPPESWFVRWGNARSNRRRFAENGLTANAVPPDATAAPSGWHQAKLARTDTVVWTRDGALARALSDASPEKSQ
jgi:hypothetical protein